jgi:hypothetical protein
MNNVRKPKPITLGTLARRLHLPIGWLKQEAEAERIPALKAGDVFLFDLDAVEQTLLERAGGRQATTN